MATFTTTTDRFPYNTTVTVYPQSNWSTGALPPSGAPVGSSTTSAVVSSASVLTFTGLTAGTSYYMTAEVDGSYRYVGFRTQAASGQVLTENGREEQSALVIPKYDKDNGQAGMYAPGGPIQNTTTTVSAANVARFGRFVPSRDFTVGSIAFGTTVAAGSNDAVDVGIYDATGAKIVTSGATTGKLNASAGVQVIDITDTALTAGTVYFAGISYGTLGSTAATLVAMGVTNATANQLFGTGIALVEQALLASGGHPLPTSMTGWASSTLCPLMALREA